MSIRMASLRRRSTGWAACALVAFTLTAAGTAHAKSHLWRFTEFFSDASGTVQFIEMFVFNEAGTGETHFFNHHLTSNANDFVFPDNLPPENTFNRWVLIATEEFAALPGAPTPDFIIPANFFDPSGDEIRYRSTIDIFTVPAGGMPIDGLHSIQPDLSTPINTPTNFAGTVGQVDLSATQLPSLTTWGLCAAFLVLTLAALSLPLRRRA